MTIGGHIATYNPDKLLFWPETLMNICGTQVKLCLSKHKIPNENLIVLHDCLETKLGQVKL